MKKSNNIEVKLEKGVTFKKKSVIHNYQDS